MNNSILAVLEVAGSLLLVVLALVVRWKFYEKLDEPGWVSLIPVYCQYVLFRDCWKPMWFWIEFLWNTLLVIMTFLGWFLALFYQNPILLLLVPFLALASAVISFGLQRNIAVSFGQGWGFTLGLFFFEIIFLAILAFGDYDYLGDEA